MILHFSIPAVNPAEVSPILARLVGGRDYAFHPVSGGRIVLFGDAGGSAIEIYPDRVEVEIGPFAFTTREAANPANRSATHGALATPLSEREIVGLCADVGWLARRCDRGPFELIEVWVENRLLLEFLPPPEQAAYRRAMTFENWESWS